ncbi:MAG: hypothetical protein CVV47_08550 [Spirochaetae bacterium HGW-Spirochaetae-3]|jgi:glycosyltransferase involved in cell wall biosynthesis|nr:MAG: hypothetical protein CVV47_08550 [Spirochaetae bacterium HGW-Spirochaetae-3]
MKVLVVHYHLKPGGVTTVIRRQLSALSAQGIDAAVLAGEASAGFGGELSVEPALAYDAPGSPDEPDPGRVRAIASAIRHEADALGSDTVVHVHNPTIRKNSSMLAALAELASSRRPLVMHVHDLAEDWRPEVYSDQPYTDGAVWAAINRFDAAALAGAGAGSVRYLPNPVPCPPPLYRSGQEPERAAGPGLVIYPVRGIRRKNLGEAVLLSLFARPGGRVGVTLPPTSPRDVPYYELWRGAAVELAAPFSFGLGLERSLEEVYAEASAVLTTSVKEGFGLSFLEPASRGYATLGRRLPRVVSDFEDEGLSFPALYDSIRVPSGLFDEAAFAARVGAVVESAALAYGIDSAGLADSVIKSIFGANSAVGANSAAGADFGRLDETAQLEALRSLKARPSARRAIVVANPFLDGWDEAADRVAPPSRESLEPWSEAAYGARLVELYRDALERRGGAAPGKDALLRLYVRPEAFHGVGV